MKHLVLKCRKYFIVALILLLAANSCDKIQDSQVPDVPVWLQIDLNIFNDLLIPGNSRYFPNRGYGGIIVTCELEGAYYAYDATCTYEISQSCRIKNEGVLGTCECCDSQFILTGGAYPAKGPAAAPLKQYQVSFLNSYTLRVYN